MSAGQPIAHPPAVTPGPGHPTLRNLLLGLGIVVVVLAAAYGALRLWRARTAPVSMEGMPGMGGEAMPPTPAGASSSAVFISPARQQLIGVRTGLVERQHTEGTTRTVGVLAYDETRTTHIHVKVAGWVERLFVDFVGKPVRRGQPLFSVYSPDLVAAESDYLVALKAKRETTSSSMPSAASAADALIAAARDRLRRWDMTDAEIAKLEASGKPSKTVTLLSPFDGVVLERETFAGQYVTPDMNTFKVADLSTIWVIGQAFELDAPRVQIGAPVRVEFPNELGTEPVPTKVEFVFPDIDPQTRRIRFRASLPNPAKKLRPDTYVSIVLQGEAVDRLVVPREAVIDTGTRKYALLALPDGYFDPRDVEVGPAIGEVYPVLSGLKEGDRVVTSAQFLVDSETNLMSAMQNMAMSMPGMDMGSMKMPAPSVAPSPSGSAPEHHHHPGMPGMPGM